MQIAGPSPPARPMPDRLKLALLLAPALLVIGVLFLGGLGVALFQSLGYMPVLGQTDLSFAAYKSTLTAPGFTASLLLSLHIALTSTVLSLILAIGAALLLRQSFAGKRIISFLFQLNLTVPHIVGALGILYLFSQSGSFARIAFHGGLITKPAEFPALVFDPYAFGIIAQYIWKEVPFIGIVILSQLQTIGQDYEAVASNLGANRLQRFRYVLLPLILPGAMSASILTFAFAFGAYEIPLLLGASHPAALPVLAYQSYTNPDLATRPQAMALAIILTVVSLALIAAYRHFARYMVRR